MTPLDYETKIDNLFSLSNAPPVDPLPVVQQEVLA